MRRGLVLVEGHGEIEAIGNLIVRLWRHLDLPQDLNWLLPVRWPGIATKKGVQKACAFAREHNPAALLLLRDSDEEGACPAVDAPTATRWIASAALPFPATVVLAYQEFEVWFMPSLHRMAGNPKQTLSPGIRPGTKPHPHPERIRGMKEWISAHSERPYKPTLHQRTLTRLISCAEFLAAGEIPEGHSGRVSSAGTLGRALCFLAANLEGSAVYPPPTSPER